MTIEVPDFNTPQAFNSWVESLSEKEIKSWKTKDWNKMYEKLDQMIQNSPEISAKQQEYYESNNFSPTEIEMIQKATPKNDPNNLYPTKQQNKRKIFMQQFGEKSINKLYLNYRLERDDFNKLISHGQEIGTKLAQQQNRPNAPKINLAHSHIYSKINIKSKETTAELADKAVFETTSYSKYNYSPMTGEPLKTYDEVKTQIEIKDINSCGNNKVLYNNPNQTKTTLSLSETDAFLSSAIHEAMHAHTQIRTQYQLQGKEELILPKDNMSHDFYTLIQNNNKFYYLPNTPSAETSRKERVDAYQGYAKQPMEKHAELVAITAERTFRKETEQYSERSAVNLAGLIPTLPDSAFYSKHSAQIFLAYDVADLAKDGANKDNLKEKYLKELDKDTKDKISVQQIDNFVYVSVPKDYSSKLAFEKLINQQKESQNQLSNTPSKPTPSNSSPTSPSLTLAQIMSHQNSH